MSTKLVLIRFNSVVSASDGEFKRYHLIETLTTGWLSGSRSRLKRFQTFAKVYMYLNKLHIHGFLDDDSYEQAWVDVLALEHARLPDAPSFKSMTYYHGEASDLAPATEVII